MNNELRADLVALLREAEAAASGDADWPVRFADYLVGPLAERLGMPFTKSRLVYCLVSADREHEARAPDSDRAEFFADLILERCAPSEAGGQDKLALYQYGGCPFCYMVRDAIDRLGLDVEMRDIFGHPAYRDELVAARGVPTVPVLRITSPDGEDRWMPESRDIVRYLESL